MNRVESYLLLKRFVRDRIRLRYALACEAVMEALATHFTADVDLWGQAGLLASLDHQLIQHNPKARGKTAADVLRAEGYSPELVDAVAVRLGPEPLVHVLHRALAAAEPAAMIVLESVEDRAELRGLNGAQLARWSEDPSIATEASRTRVLALKPDGIKLTGLLELARAALLERADDLGL